MAALIVGLAVMAVMMTVAMPVWKQTVQREKEAELVFRGEQIARSIGLFQRKFANAYPPTLDVLVEQKFLRKKYKDPITNDDFVPLTQAQQAAGTPGGATRAGRPASRTTGHPAPRPAGGGPVAPGCWRSGRRHHRRHEQEQRRFHSPLQRTLALQRVGLCLHPAGRQRPALVGTGSTGPTRTTQGQRGNQPGPQPAVFPAVPAR